MDERGIPHYSERQLVVGETWVKRATMAGLEPEDFYLAPSVMTISVVVSARHAGLTRLRLVWEHLPEVRTVRDVTTANYSTGNPWRC
jgi:hypothetical protein